MLLSLHAHSPLFACLFLFPPHPTPLIPRSQAVSEREFDLNTITKTRVPITNTSALRKRPVARSVTGEAVHHHNDDDDGDVGVGDLGGFDVPASPVLGMSMSSRPSTGSLGTGSMRLSGFAGPMTPIALEGGTFSFSDPRPLSALSASRSVGVGVQLACCC